MLSPLQQQALRAPRSIGVHSVAFQHGKQIPREFTGHGDDINPPLSWTGVPNNAQALAIVVDDPDAAGGTFTHWTVWNLPPRIGGVEAGVKVVPLGGIEGRNDFGTSGYRGPKPPGGTHRYVFRVLALDKFLDAPPNAPVDEVWRHISGHSLAWGELVGTFTKP
ncbi:MAG TPA: YbhB/YbcL family Raf kinase inhibitor-like protein [Candidatus Thermoplasmatota archaeon]|nr:YbhB/YbcL family Raf kinase inhibitor-like protein [Candidatus Thermoplasmatota archaeon]